LKTILKRALGSPAQPLKIVNDQYGSPTWSHRLARQVERVIESGAEGLFHATAEGYCTWYDFARLFLAEMGVACEVRPLHGGGVSVARAAARAIRFSKMSVSKKPESI
jgi:dTDP-4-dehydrorhamnose reductase